MKRANCFPSREAFLSRQLQQCAHLVLLASFSLHAPPANAQTDRGTIAGTVTESSKAVLQGAQVLLEPGGQTTVTDAQGGYTFSGIKPGHYTLRVSYIGFEAFSIEKDVTAGAIANGDVSLSIENAASSVTVRPEREVGEAESLNRQRVAINILQVLPSEVINSLPNVNIADAVGRLPSVSIVRDEGEGKYIQIRGTEPRLNNVTVDGVQLPSPENVRYIKLDTIPADLVESVELNKTLTADMNGDGIGGSLNLVTRQATDQPYFAVEGLFGHTPINGTRQENQEFGTYGRRFLAGKLGVLATGSYDYNARGINDIEPNQGVNPINGSATDTVSSPNSIDLRDYYYDRSRYGAGGTVDYKFNEHTTAYLKGLYSYLDDFGEDSINRLTFGSFISPTQTDQTGNTVYENIYRRPVQEIFSTSVGARKEAGQSTLSGHIAYSQAKITGGFTTSQFTGITPGINPDGSTEQNGVAFNTATKDVFLPGVRVTATPNNVSIYDGSQYSLSSINFQDNHTFERDVEGQADYAHGYTLGPNFGTWQIGFQVRDVIKNQLDDQPSASALSWNILLTEFPSRRDDSDFYMGHYQVGPQSQATSILAFYKANPTQFQSTAGGGQSDLQADFHVSERVYAGYLENTITHGRFRYNSGVRIESTTDGVFGYAANANNGLTPLYKSNNYVYVLPSAGVQYNAGDLTDFRLAYSIGLARPNYGDLAPFVQYNPGAADTAAAPVLTGGNPTLKATWAENLDLLGEHYLKNVGVIQGGLFYKQIFDDIFQSIVQVQYTQPGQTQSGPVYEALPVNGGSSHLIGVEASYEQHLTQLPGALGGTGYRFNYSYVASVATVPGRSDKPSLAGDAPNNWNVDLTYDKYGISARMGLTHNDAYISAYQYTDGTSIAGSPSSVTVGGPKGPGGDNYYYPHTQVDAQVNYLLPKGHGVSAVAQFLNLNNEVFGFFNGQEQYPVQREYYSPTYTFGLRWTSTSEQGTVFKQ